MVFLKISNLPTSDNDERIRAFRQNNTTIILSKFMNLPCRKVLRYLSRDS